MCQINQDHQACSLFLSLFANCHVSGLFSIAHSGVPRGYVPTKQGRDEPAISHTGAEEGIARPSLESRMAMKSLIVVM
jgi:hypothetical protein